MKLYCIDDGVNVPHWVETLDQVKGALAPGNPDHITVNRYDAIVFLHVAREFWRNGR